MQDSNSYFKVI